MLCWHQNFCYVYLPFSYCIWGHSFKRYMGYTSSVILQIMYWPKNFGDPLRSIKLWHVTQLNIGADDLTLAWPLDTRATLWTLESYINCIHVFIFWGNDTHFEILKSVIVIRFCNIFFIIVNIGWCPVPPNKRIEHKFSEHRTPSLKHMSMYFVKLWMSNCIRKKNSEFVLYYSQMQSTLFMILRFLLLNSRKS